jgi:tetratricopeptide (TPR) repeat protein
MRRWKHIAHITGATFVLLLSGCSFISKSDYIDVQDPVSATVLILDDWNPGSGFVIDGPERFLVTSARVGGVRAGKEVDVVFPVIENGKALVNKEKLRKSTHAKAKVLYPDVERYDPDTLRDVSILQLADAPPEGFVTLKLAATDPENGASVSLLTAASKTTVVWTHSTSTVQGSGPKKAKYDADMRHISARMFELDLDGKQARGVAGGPVVNDKNELVGLVASDPVQKEKLQCISLTEVRVVLGGAHRQLAAKASDEGRRLLDQAGDDKKREEEGKQKMDEAIAQCNKALAIAPHDPRTYNERGAAYSFKDQFDKAVADYTQAIRLDPDLALAYRNRGSAYYHLGTTTKDPAAAAQLYQKAVDDCTLALNKTDGRYPMALYTRSQAYAKLNKKTESEADTRALNHLSEPRYVVISKTGDTGVRSPE